MDLGLATQITIMAVVLSVILLFVGVGVSVLIHVCIVGRAFRRGLIINNNPAIDQQGNATTGRRRASMSQDDLEKLPSYEYESKGQGEGVSGSPIRDCAVCLENFSNGDKCRLLPTCNHSFHAKCVDAWLVKTPVCPICRSSAADPIPVTGGESSQGSDNFAISIDTGGSVTSARSEGGSTGRNGEDNGSDQSLGASQEGTTQPTSSNNGGGDGGAVVQHAQGQPNWNSNQLSFIPFFPSPGVAP